jgi:hypothetical protein
VLTGLHTKPAEVRRICKQSQYLGRFYLNVLHMRLLCLASRCDTIRPHGHLLRLRGRIVWERPFLFFMRACDIHSRHADPGAG